jgi:hypothetical protein
MMENWLQNPPRCSVDTSAMAKRTTVVDKSDLKGGKDFGRGTSSNSKYINNECNNSKKDQTVNKYELLIDDRVC